MGLINNVLNRYFDIYFPRAVALAEAMRSMGLDERFIYTTHPFLLHLYLDCRPFSLSGIPLHCPGPDAQQAMCVPAF